MGGQGTRVLSPERGAWQRAARDSAIAADALIEPWFASPKAGLGEVSVFDCQRHTSDAPIPSPPACGFPSPACSHNAPASRSSAIDHMRSLIMSTGERFTFTMDLQDGYRGRGWSQ